MLSEKDIEELIKKQISKDEKTGEHAGGSGHLSFVTSSIDQTVIKKEEKNHLVITYWYTISIESEFTCYPDNPPYVNHYKRTIIIDKKGRIINESEKKHYTAEDFEKWNSTREEITDFIKEILYRIEWNYGDNRAPIRYPPKFKVSYNDTGPEFYYCYVYPDTGQDNESPHIFKTTDMNELIDVVKKELPAICGTSNNDI
jgi:hypothetical protein